MRDREIGLQTVLEAVSQIQKCGNQVLAIIRNCFVKRGDIVVRAFKFFLLEVSIKVLACKIT